MRSPVARKPFVWILAAVALALASSLPLALADEGATELPKGIGPIDTVELGPLDAELVAQGQEAFDTQCSACHKFDERYVGPALQGVTERRSPEWIMNWILNTNEMLMDDDTAYELLAEYMTPMPQLPLEEASVRAILEYFRSVDAAAAE